MRNSFSPALGPGTRLFNAVIGSQGAEVNIIFRKFGTGPCEKTEIIFGFYRTVFGEALIAETGWGLCFVHPGNDREEALKALASAFKNNKLKARAGTFAAQAAQFFSQPNQPQIITLHVKGTEFQIRVWQTLLQIRQGCRMTYGEIAGMLGDKKAARAVGAAVAANKVAYFIPCHRVVTSSGSSAGFRWGRPLRQQMLKWEDENFVCHQPELFSGDKF